MATTRLKLYNGALMLLGERALSSLTENREPRYLLDDVWNDGAVDYCLSQGQWRFAMRTQRLDYDTSITPDFGLLHAFLKSDDWILTSAVCSDEYFRVPLLTYTDEAGYLYSDLTQIYVKFVSNDSAYGGNLALWGPSFVEFVKAFLASKIIYKLSASESRREELIKKHNGIVDMALEIARNRDAIQEPTKFPAQGSWSLSRRSRGSRTRFDGGSINQLIG